MKLAFIVPRYGREIPGGAETLARQIAERLSRRHQIDVLTTTARDYVTWKNEYPESEEKLRGVRVVRFPVEQERNIEEFNRFSDWIYNNPHTREDELRWLEMQGPVVPKLIEYLQREHQRYDLLVFFTYLYYPTFYGIEVAPEKSVLLPTAHDEPPLKLGIYKEVFDNANSFIFNTEAEELLVLQRFDVHRKMRETIGIGMELLDPPDTSEFRRRYHVSNRFLLYAGRIDEGKGCGELLKFFRLFREEHPEYGNLQLLLIGKKNMSIPSSRHVRYLGFLDEDEKLAAMASANAVVIPSRLESLSIVALESFSVGTPIVVHGGSRVLVDHCRKANAGLYYTSYEEFDGIVETLLGDKNLARGLGRQGQQYIKDNFGWEKLLAHYELAFRSSARERRPRVASARRPRGGFGDRERGESALVSRPPAPEGGQPREEEPEAVEAATERRPVEAVEPEAEPESSERAEAGRTERPAPPEAREQVEDAQPSEEAGRVETDQEPERLEAPTEPAKPEQPEWSEQESETTEATEPDERDLFGGDNSLAATPSVAERSLEEGRQDWQEPKAPESSETRDVSEGEDDSESEPEPEEDMESAERRGESVEKQPASSESSDTSAEAEEREDPEGESGSRDGHL